MKTATTIIHAVLALLAVGYFGHPEKAQATDLGGVLPGGNNADGFGVMTSLTTGGFNTGAGWLSLHALTAGSYNTGVGAGTLFANTGNQNTATGAAALFSNTTGFRNTANGAFALLHNNAADNTAVGNAALYTNTTGSGNTATGNFALAGNDTGSNNTAMGNGALSTNTIANNNTAIGAGALASSTGFGSNGNNTAIGAGALPSNTSGIGNTACGFNALFSNTTGSDNVALGDFAGQLLTSGNGNIEIGNPGESGEANTTRLGAFQTRAFIAGIYNVTTGGPAIPVVIDASGQLGTFSSSRRFKKGIKPMDKASEAILALKPVRFQYKSDKTNTSQFGLIAEEVAEVNPDLVVRDKEGKPYTVRYDAVNAMLLNEFLKEHCKVEEQQATIEQQQATIAELKSSVARQQKGMDALATRLKEQDAKIQRVSDQIRLSRSAPQMVNNNR